ncbi:MAG TPA: hypothetical protein VMR54_13025 [Thermoanaerobaculia bacterium]|nr:hypothetical protein [Thermoanaerobaculia bacterium]
MRTLRLVVLLAVLALNAASPDAWAALPDVDIVEAPIPAPPDAKPATPPKSRAVRKRRHPPSHRETEAGAKRVDADRRSGTPRSGPESFGI